MKADIERFLEHLRVDRQSASNTISAYRTDLQQFERLLAGQPGGITQQSVAGYATWLQGKGYTPATGEQQVVRVKRFEKASADGGAPTVHFVFDMVIQSSTIR